MGKVHNPETSAEKVLVEEAAKLRRENERLQARLEQAEAIIEVQKTLATTWPKSPLGKAQVCGGKMSVNFEIKGHIIVPFGCAKWDINQIQISGVSSDATYFTSKTNCVYIDKSKTNPLRLNRFCSYFPDEEASFPEIENPVEALRFIENTIKEKCMVATYYEKRFIEIYFEYMRNHSQNYVSDNVDYFGWWERSNHLYMEKLGLQRVEELMLFLHLMPFPQAHIYANDPFIESTSFSPNRMMRVDFAFWTGEKFVVVEVDGESHVGSLEHIERDRLLLRSGVHVIHILNEEIDKYGSELVGKLLPSEVAGIDYIVLLKEMGVENKHPGYERVNSLFNPFSAW